VITLGLGLETAGGRRQALALLLTGVAVAAGTAFLLLALCVEPAYAARAARSEIFGSGTAISVDRSVPAGRFTALRQDSDAFRDRTIQLVDLAGLAPDAPHPAGLLLPRPGELLLSPGLAELATREPLLAQRYPPSSRELPAAAVPSAASLIAVRGFAAADVTSDGSWGFVSAFAVPERRSHGPVFDLVIALGAVAVLAPIVVFVATATRLTATGRERRLAALRLAGATTGQVLRLAAVEALLVGVAAAVAGIGLFALVRPLATAVTIDDPWYVSDLTPPPFALAAALAGVPLAAVAGALVALRRTAVSPLGIGRRARPRRPRAWRLLPLALAVAAFLALAVTPSGDGSVTGPLAVVFAALLAALLYAGPWLTGLVGAGLARLGPPAALLAGRRLSGDPRLGFRAVGGAVLGTFVVTLFLTVLPALTTEIPPGSVSALAPGVALGRAADAAGARAAQAALAGVPGVTAVPMRELFSTAGGEVWIGDCGALARVAGVDPAACASGRVLVAPSQPDLTGIISTRGDPVAVRGEPATVLPDGVDAPRAIVPAGALDPLPADTVAWQVAVVAGPDALERARTQLAAAGIRMNLATAVLRTGLAGRDATRLDGVLRGALLATFVIAGCSAAVAAATGLLERRRSFALLRLGGTPTGVLRRSAVLELAVPLVVASLVAAALGALAGRLIGLAGGVDRPVPWASLGIPLAAGIVIALALGSAVLPLVGRVSDADAARFE
jgi:hypothetical protein